MDNRRSVHLRTIHRLFSGGLNLVEYLGLLVVGIATTVAMFNETQLMIETRRVLLADLLLMFLYLEVLAMIGQYFKHGHVPVRYPIYIGMVALARYLILDIKEMSEWRLLAIATSILLLTLAVLVIRYGHVRFPYHEDDDEKPYGKS
jgi:protein PsiE